MRLQDKDWVFRKEGDEQFLGVEVHTAGQAQTSMQQIQKG